MAQSLVAVISPAKSLDDTTHYPELPASEILFPQEAEALIQKLKKLSAKKVGELMDLSPDLSALNQQRFNEWHLPFDYSNAIQAILMFRGEVYRGMKADTFTKKDLAFAQDHLRILSGLYGILRPLDLVQAYRLMMGTPFSPSAKVKNLYAFWGEKIALALQDDIDKKGVLVNLASKEYFKAISTAALDRKVIHCEFKEKKAGAYAIVGTYAKLARGMMAHYLVKNAITKPEHLKSFDADGYSFLPKQSTETEWVFGRGV